MEKTKTTKAQAKAIQNHKAALRKAILEEVTNALQNVGYGVQSSAGFKGASGTGVIVSDDKGYSCQVKIIVPKQLEKGYTMAEEITEEPAEGE